MVVLELQNLTKIYRRRHLGKLTETPGIENVSLSVHQGELFGLLGLNGAGKTTALKLLLGLLRPTQGSVTLLGHPVPSLEALREIGYMPEVPYLYKTLTVEEVLILYGRLSNLSVDVLQQRIQEVLERVRMTPHHQKRLGECSKGMLQRTALAQALLHDPRLLVFDEPVSGLDPLGLKEMRELLLSLNRQGKTIFFSSHIISEVEKICHRVAILHNGRLARVLEQREWGGREGRLEELFIETVQ